MNRLFLFLFSLILFVSASASTTLIRPPKSPVINAKSILIPVGKSHQTISLYDLSRISKGDLETLTGRHMNFMERISLDLTQKKLRNGMSEDGAIKDKKLDRFFHKGGGETGFHLGGFALGFFLGLIGVIVAYVINDDYKSNRVKWAWIGWGLSVVIYIIAVVSTL